VVDSLDGVARLVLLLAVAGAPVREYLARLLACSPDATGPTAMRSSAVHA